MLVEKYTKRYLFPTLRKTFFFFFSLDGVGNAMYRWWRRCRNSTHSTAQALDIISHVTLIFESSWNVDCIWSASASSSSNIPPPPPSLSLFLSLLLPYHPSPTNVRPPFYTLLSNTSSFFFFLPLDPYVSSIPPLSSR